MGRMKLFVPHEATRFAGFRALLAVAENVQEPVHAAFGMYLFSHAVWLAKEMQRGGFDRIVFIARDGYWVRCAYDLVAPALGVHVPSDYVRISRQAAFPLSFARAEELASLADWIDVTAHTERSLMRLLAANLKEGAADTADDTRLLTAADIPAFARRCGEMWDAARAAAYRAHATAYIAPKFVGKCAAFDVGYNLRSESVIRDLTGADVTAFITHTDSDLPDRRGVPYCTLYPASPYVSWVAREQFLLEDAPLCVGYDENGPVLSSTGTHVHPNILRCQRAARDFVAEMVRIHGDGLAAMPLRPADGCIPFEHFLHCGPQRQMKPYRRSTVDNAFHAGGAGEKPGENAFLQWRLMQTDLLLARGVPRWRVRMKRALIRLREEPGRTLRRLNPFASE